MSVPCESGQDILDIAVTAEALAVAALGNVLKAAQDGKLGLNAEQQTFIQATQFEEQQHYNYLAGAGAKPLTTSFTLPDEKILSDVPTLLQAAIGLEEAFIAAYMTALQEFAIWQKPDLVKAAYQIGGVECEHRAHLRFYAVSAGVISGTPNNYGFEKAMFSSLADAANALKQAGWIGGSGPQFSYPGPISPSNPNNLVKNTTPS